MLFATAGRLSMGTAFFGFGALHLLYADFVTRVLPWWPEALPARPAAAVVSGALLAAAGVAMLVRYHEGRAASLLAMVLLASFVGLAFPMAASDRLWAGSWTVAGKVIALCGGTLLVARRAVVVGGAASGTIEQIAARLWTAAPWGFGAFLALCGVQHFVHVEFVASLVPAWIPGARPWTWFTGVALMAGGVGVVLARTAWLAGLLTGGMIYTWLLILHIPRAVAAPADGNPNELVAVFEALAMGGIGWLIADRAAEQAGRGDVRAAA